ncbi:hypothetical protein HKX48_006731 [Thoreauomyces humboldtii]|nr:hypothetical protein HKX48_006731 [Thoreauomyces humboldtii]
MPGKLPIDLSLYLVTDQDLLPSSSDLVEVVRAAIEGGVTLVQLREKKLDTQSFVAVARRVLEVCRAAGVPLLINDRLDVALAVDADGVHIGQNDMPLVTARALLGPDKIVGVTVETVAHALRAVAEGADYLGTAAIFATNTKKHPDSFKPLGHDGVKEILASVAKFHIPVCTIGGVNLSNVESVLRNTVTEEAVALQGVAVVSAIIAASDPRAASAELFTKIRPLVSPAFASIPASPPVRSDSRVSSFLDQIVVALASIKASKPLIHNITNYVVMNDTANTILQLGGSPVMAHAVDEVEEMTSYSQALVLNLGTLSPLWIEAMGLAAKKANQLAIPVILDPVGAGATAFRKQTSVQLLDQIKFAVIKGNAGEIAALAGLEGVAMRGVDSAADLSDPAQTARSLATKLKTCVAISGIVDTVSDGTRTVSIHNGNDWLGTMTGTGCTASSLIACFAGVQKDPMVAAVGGLLCVGIAAEMAMKEKSVRGPGSFKVALHDAIYNLDAETLRSRARINMA